MSNSVIAIYEDGVFKPLQKVSLPEHQKIELIILRNDDDSIDLVKSQKKAISELTGIGNSGLTNVARNHNRFLYKKD